MTKYEIDFDFSSDETMDCVVKHGFHGSGKSGQYFGNVLIKGQKWAIILFDDEDDPVLFKAEGLQIAKINWVDIP